MGLKADVVLLREDLLGKGPACVFAGAGIESRLIPASTLPQALSGQAAEAGQNQSDR